MICPICQKEIALARGRFVAHGDCPGGFARTDLATTRLESRYTDAWERCPHPERWHAEDWDSAEDEVSRLVAAFVTALQPDLVIETGTAFGVTAEQIGRALRVNGQGVLHTIEIDPARCEIARKRCEGLPVVVEQMDSLSFVPPGAVGFAWFDSLVHLRVPEFMRYLPYITPGAIVGFHDTRNTGLWQEIERLEADGHLLPIRLPTPRGCVIAEVLG